MACVGVNRRDGAAFNQLGPGRSPFKWILSAKAVEQDFPHFVEIVVPPGGLGSRLDAMYAFRERQGIRAKRGHGRHDANGSVVRWCFC